MLTNTVIYFYKARDGSIGIMYNDTHTKIT